MCPCWVHVKLVEFAIMVYTHTEVQVTVSSSETGSRKDCYVCAVAID